MATSYPSVKASTIVQYLHKCVEKISRAAKAISPKTILSLIIRFSYWRKGRKSSNNLMIKKINYYYYLLSLFIK